MNFINLKSSFWIFKIVSISGEVANIWKSIKESEARLEKISYALSE